MKNGLMLYDRNPSVGILPVYPIDHDERWERDGYEAIVLAESAEQYILIGATQSPVLSTLNSSVPEDRQKIKLAIASMAQSALQSVVLFRSEAVPKYGSLKKSKNETHDKYIWEIHKSIEDTMWVPDADRIPDNMLFRVVRFGPVEYSNTAPKGLLHPAPIPDFLQQRNLNVLVNYFYKRGAFDKAPVIPGVAAAFWPSCLDLDVTGKSCNLCRWVSPHTSTVPLT